VLPVTVLSDVFRHIDDHLNESVARLTELCKLPSVSAHPPTADAIAETAEHVASLLHDLDFESRILPKPPAGHPVVYAEQSGRSPRTLLFYDYYDVQPPEPLELWSSPPFQLTERDGKLYGRGGPRTAFP
jgi:acetylornithine deacetylase/succinyl-diaminopimelate desuccinylase-like protein